MESFEHLLPGNVLILGEKNKELELDGKVRKNLQNGVLEEDLQVNLITVSIEKEI